MPLCCVRICLWAPGNGCSNAIHENGVGYVYFLQSFRLACLAIRRIRGFGQNRAPRLLYIILTAEPGGAHRHDYCIWDYRCWQCFTWMSQVWVWEPNSGMSHEHIPDIAFGSVKENSGICETSWFMCDASCRTAHYRNIHGSCSFV